MLNGGYLENGSFSTQAEQLCDQVLSQKKTITWISEITGLPESSVEIRLRNEFGSYGDNVRRDLRKAGLKPHVWSKEWVDFYERTDAFLYELVIWNLNEVKRRMRSWMLDYLADGEKRVLNILIIGDGLGLDSMCLSQLGHRVTYFEVPGCVAAFARKVFAEGRSKVTVVTDKRRIPMGEYDVVVCLDVLEHIPNVSTFVKTIADYLRSDGLLIVHAPFYTIHSRCPTHLRENRRYSGDLSLYEKCNLRIIDGRAGWNPIVLRKTGSSSLARSRFDPKLLFLKSMGLYWFHGRLSVLPFSWICSFRGRQNRWFNE